MKTIHRFYRRIILAAVLCSVTRVLAASPTALFPVARGIKYGFIDETGKIVVEPQFDLTGAQQWGEPTFAEGLQPINVGDAWGYIDATGRVAVAPQFEAALPFSGGLAAVRVAEKNAAGYRTGRDYWGYIDHNGQFVIKPAFYAAGSFSEGLAFVVVDGKVGYINPAGRMIIEPQFKSWSTLSNFREGLACVQVGDKAWEFIDKTGAVAIPPSFEQCSAFSDGLAAVTKQGEARARSGYIDRTGKMVIADKFKTWRFSEGLARVEEMYGRPAFIDRSGKVVFHPDDATDASWFEPFSGGSRGRQVSIRTEWCRDSWVHRPIRASRYSAEVQHWHIIRERLGIRDGMREVRLYQSARQGCVGSDWPAGSSSTVTTAISGNDHPRHHCSCRRLSRAAEGTTGSHNRHVFQFRQGTLVTAHIRRGWGRSRKLLSISWREIRS